MNQPNQLATPPHYSFPDERDAMQSLFTNIHEMLDYIHSLEGRLEHFTQQIRTVEIDGGYRDSGEPEIRQLPAVRDDDGPVD